jgi:hypothetical protein
LRAKRAAAPPGAIAAIASLDDDPFKPHDTYLPEYDRAVRILDMLRQAEALMATIQKLGQQGASRVPALRAQIAARLTPNTAIGFERQTKAQLDQRFPGLVEAQSSVLHFSDAIQHDANASPGRVIVGSCAPGVPELSVVGWYNIL